MEFISDVWERPPDGHIHVSVGLPSGVGDPTLVNTGGKFLIRLFGLASSWISDERAA